MKRVTIVMAVLMAVVTAHAEDSLKVLFVGNSYTGQVRGKINKLLKASPYKDSTFAYISPGGRTLVQHSQNPDVIKKIQEGTWDYVILQDQSQTPALPNLRKGFLAASEMLCKVIVESGAKPVFYMTWGRRDGDTRNQAIFPDYETMQRKLTDAYTEAAKDNKAMIAPVGLIWAKARTALKDDYAVLYKKDGSHPSGYGAFLVACVFFKTLFKSDLKFIKPANDQEKLIKDLVLRHR